MNKEALNKIQYILTLTAAFIGVSLLCLMSISAFVSTAYAEDMLGRMMLEKSDNVILSLLEAGLALAVGFFLAMVFSDKKRIKYLFIFTIAWYILMGAIFILFSRSAPAADALTTLRMAEMYAANDLSFVGTDSYLTYYPQQIGLTVFLGMIIKAVKILPYSFAYYHIIKVIYCLINCLTFSFGYLLVKNMWGSSRINATYMILSIFNLPFIMYASFVYSEIPSFCLIMGGTFFIYMMIKEKGMAPVNIVFGIICLTLSVLIRKNSLIFVIAVLIVLILKFMESRRADILLSAVILLILCFTILPVTLKIFEAKTGRDVSKGVTALSYFAMGMQEGGFGPGWYNGFNFDTFTESGMDPEKSNEISREAIKERREYFKNNSEEFVKFYKGKFLTQWTDPTYAACQATYDEYGGRINFFKSLYTGKWNATFIHLCNIYQNLIYAGAFVWAVFRFVPALKNKKEDMAADYILLIAVIGGFIFHMLWEANSRYIFLYAMMLIPYAAAAIGGFFDKVSAYNPEDK